jgi:hypothetical protein
MEGQPPGPRGGIGLLPKPAGDSALLRRVIDEIWNAGDLDLADELFASTYSNHGGLISDLIIGPEAIKFSVALYRLAFPDLHIEVTDLRSIASRVRLSWTGRPAPAARAIAADAYNDVKAQLTGHVICMVEDGRIVESWMGWDSTLALGIFDKPAGPDDETS